MAITRLGPNQDITAAKIAGQINFKNLIINGDMSIAQRGTKAVGGSTGLHYGGCDRLRVYQETTASAYTLSQDTNVPTAQGFANSFKLDVTTADASLNAGDRVDLIYRFEGQELQHIKKGTSSAESLTLSFWVSSPKTGTHICEMYDSDNARQISKSYTVSSANTWEKKTITFEGDTSGALNNDNNLSLQISWWLMAGSNYTSGTLSTSWTSNTNANRAVGQVNVMDSTSNNFYLTGVQLEVGTSASDFEFLPYDVNLQRCYRYYEKDTSVYRLFLNSGSDFGSREGHLQWKATKRATPSLTANPDAGSINLTGRTIYGCPLRLGGAVSGASHLPSGYIADSEL